MSVQSSLVFVVVTGSLVYAVWVLMPQSARRALALALLRLPLPQRQRLLLQQAAVAAPGCGCSGCDLARTKAPHAPVQSLVFHPRKRP